MRWLLLLLLALPARAVDLSAVEWRPHPGAPLPMTAPLRDASGGATTLAAAAGGLPLVLAPGYFRCPNLCGVVRADLFAALDASGLRAGRDYAVALLTIDPAETPADAAAAREGVLSQHQDASPHALTGPATSLDAIAQAAGFQARFDAAMRGFAHPAGVVLVSPGGTVSSYLTGVGYAPAALAEAIARARHGETLGAEPVRLLCFTYDPATGRVALLAGQALRAACVVTVLGLGAGLVLLHRRARA